MATSNSKTVERPTFRAALTKTAMEKGGVVAQSWGPIRRLAYATLTRPAKELLRNLDVERSEALLSLAENITDYLRWRERETELLESARARILTVLMHKSSEVTQ